MKVLQNTQTLQRARQQHEVYDDFQWYISPHLWTSLAADTNSAVSAGDAAGGILTVDAGDAVDNNEAAVKTTKEVFLVAADAVLYGEAKLKFAEPATNTANIAFGFGDAIGANFITDNGAAITANSALLIYKKDGETVWRAYSENNSVITETVSGTTAGGTAYQTLSIEAIVVDGTNVEVTFFVDGQPLREQASGLNRPIKHRIAYASWTEMMVGVYIKTGSAHALTCTVDYIYAAQRRIN